MDENTQGKIQERIRRIKLRKRAKNAKMERKKEERKKKKQTAVSWTKRHKGKKMGKIWE